VLRDLLDIAVIVFAVASMLLVGLSHSARRIVGPLRDLRLVALALLANFVLVPALALGITTLLDVSEPYEVGLLLVASAAGAPILVKLVTMSDGDVAFSASLLLLLLPATVVYMPVVVPLIAPDADIDAIAIAGPLTIANLLPLGVGMILLAVVPGVAARLRPVLGPTSTVALVALVALTFAANADELLDVLGQRAIVAAALIIVGAFVIGFVLGAPDHHKDEIALATAQRNIAAATVVATQAIGDADTVVTVVVASTVSMVLLFPLATQLRKRFGQTAETERRSRPDRPTGSAPSSP
jgi:BASS family bile acid:Na+ symporter